MQEKTWFCSVTPERQSQEAQLKGYGTVWFYPEGTGNILSLRNLEEKHGVI